MSQHNKISLLGVNIDWDMTSDLIDEEILSIVRSGKKALVLNVNIYAMNLASKYEWFRLFLNDSHLVFCDGDGVRIGARILGMRIKEKITYNRWIWEFARFSELNGLSWYLMGSSEQTIARAAEVLAEKYPKLMVLGYRNGYFNDEREKLEAIKVINELSPNVLIMGMGMPLQEKFLEDHREKISFNVALTGGAVFDYISGNAKMTPDIFYKLKLEWLYRLIHDPKRLYKRYVYGNPIFFYRIFKEKIRLSFSAQENESVAE